MSTNQKLGTPGARSKPLIVMDMKFIKPMAYTATTQHFFIETHVYLETLLLLDLKIELKKHTLKVNLHIHILHTHSPQRQKPRDPSIS